MDITREQWYAIDDEDGGRQTVYVSNILRSYTAFDTADDDGTRDETFVRLANEVDGYGAIPPQWSLTVEEFLARNPSETTTPP